MKILPTLIEAVKSADKAIYELALKQIMILCENNPKVMLNEFENKG